jgi:hypothetical protein
VATQPTSAGSFCMSVTIGIDPHKSTHTAVAVDRNEQPIPRFTFPARAGQTERLLAWADTPAATGIPQRAPATVSRLRLFSLGQGCAARQARRRYSAAARSPS